MIGNRITSSQEIIDSLQPVPNFKSKNDIKIWIHDILNGRGINLVIERSDSSKVVFKCKNLHRKQNTSRSSLHEIESAENKKKRLRSIPEDSCPFRLRVSYSVKNKNWSVNIINDEHNPALCSNFGNHNGGSAFPTPNSSISTPVGGTAASSAAAMAACSSMNKRRCGSSAYNTPIHLQSPLDSPLASQAAPAYGTPDYVNDTNPTVQPSASSQSFNIGKLSVLDEFEELNSFQLSGRNRAFQRHQLTNIQRSSSTSPQSPYQLPSQAHLLPKKQQQQYKDSASASFLTDFQIPEVLRYNNDNSLQLNHRTATNLSDQFEDIHSSDNKLLDNLEFELNLFDNKQSTTSPSFYLQTNNHSPTNSIPLSPCTNLPLAPFSLKSQGGSIPKESWQFGLNQDVEVLFDQDSILEFFQNPENYEENYLNNEVCLEENDLQLFLQSTTANPSLPVTLQQQQQQLKATAPQTPAPKQSSPSRYRNIQPAPAKTTTTRPFQTIQPKAPNINHHHNRNNNNKKAMEDELLFGNNMTGLEELDRVYKTGVSVPGADDLDIFDGLLSL